MLTVGFGGHFAAYPSFLGNWLSNHPELQVVLSAHSPSQACSNWRGKMQFITVNSGNKYSISHKDITDTTKDLVLLPNASCCQQKFLNRILHVVANTSGKITYTCVLHMVCYFTCRKDVCMQKHCNHSLHTKVLSSHNLPSPNLNSYFRNTSCCLHITVLYKDIWKCACF